jgi:hypothetical protein
MSEILVRPAVLEDVPAIVGVRYRSWLCAYPNERYGITAQDIVNELLVRRASLSRQHLKYDV